MNTDEMRQLAQDAQARAEKATPGPWYWDINRHFYQVKLMTDKNGHCVVMDFVRWGMQKAQPRFSDRPRQNLGGVMRTIEEIDKTDAGLSAFPDAIFIARAREDVPALAAALLEAAGEIDDAMHMVHQGEAGAAEMGETIRELTAERDALREALEQYARRSNWIDTPGDGPFDPVGRWAYDEHGWTRARDALAALRQAGGGE